MSTMPAQHGHSAACCNLPPVVTHGYSPKGSYEQIGGVKTYVTGDASAEKAILYVADIFGFFEQTVQGADLLASGGDAGPKYRVFVPDQYDGQYAPIDAYPPTTPEKQQTLGAFFQKHKPPQLIDLLSRVVDAACAANPAVKSWAVVGFCYGAKVAQLLAAQAGKDAYRVVAGCHPAQVDPNDAKGLAVPVCLLVSKDEDADAVAKYEKALTVPNHVETFADQVHGWMATRGDLADERVKAEYTRGYKTVLEFLHQHWA